MKRICVFCGSSPGENPEYTRAARMFGSSLAKRGVGLVYGGAGSGVMGHLARGALAAGGTVVGVMPRGLVEKERALAGISELHVVGSLDERKALMTRLGDGFVALPGGYGTIDELFEVLTLAQLSLHRKPCGLLNVCGYFDMLVSFLDHAVRERFVRSRHRERLIVQDDGEVLLDSLFSC